ncbi:MAG: phospholipase D-like domain-containing protein [Pseudomonadota bacterium]
MQKLTYNQNAAPYACLTLPWWVRTPYPTYGPRHGCSIEPLVCGERVFAELAADIRKAKHSVDIITWGFDPGMVLVRGASAQMGQRYGDLLKEIATRKDNPVKVRLLVWHDDPLSQHQMKNIPGFYGTHFASVGCSSAGFYSEGHQDYNAAWFEEICAQKIPNIRFHVRSVPDSCHSSSMHGETPPFSVKSIIAQWYATHHQKMVLIDYEMPKLALGYVMGHNSITDFWDTKDHVFRDPRRETFYKKAPVELWENAWQEGVNFRPEAAGYVPSEREVADKERSVRIYMDRYRYVAKPYQDVSCRLRGPVLSDLNHNFCQAWGESDLPTSLFADAYPYTYSALRMPWLFAASHGVRKIISAVASLGDKEMDPDFIARRKQIGWRAFSLPAGQHSVQLMRTQPMHGEKAIKECYANLTRQTHHYIFIQNQYIQYAPWAEHFMESVARLRAGGYTEQIYVFILTSTPESDGMDLPTYSVAGRLGRSEDMVVEHAEALAKARSAKGTNPITPEQMAKQGIHVIMGSMWTCAKKTEGETMRKDDYEEIYIHAKVAIVDDAAFTLGSANLNLRSMVFDSELNILSDAMDVAYQLRTELFEQCTGDPGPKQFGDMAGTYKKWKTTMADNLNHKKNFKPLECQLFPFHVDRKPGSPVV